MVNDQIGWNEGIDPPRVAPQAVHGATHRCQVNNGRHAGKVLQNNPRGFDRDLHGFG